MTFTPPDSLEGSVDLDTTDLEVNFERRVANCVSKHVKKKVTYMFWTMNKTITTVANCSANVTEEYITKKEHTILLKEAMNEASYGILAGFFTAEAATVGTVSSP